LGVLIEFSFLLNTFPRKFGFEKGKVTQDPLFSASLFGSDTNPHFQWNSQKSFPVADLPRLGGFDDRIPPPPACLRPRAQTSSFSLGKKIDGVFAATINLRVPLF